MHPYGTGPGRHYPAVPGQQPYVSGHERVGNAQRTVVLELLSRAVGEGYLDLDEYEARVVKVTAGKTVAALYAVAADLPPHLRWDPMQGVPRRREDRERESAAAAAVTALALGAVSVPVSLCVGVGAVPGIIALFFAARGMRDEASRTKALTGLVLAIVGTAMSLGMVLLTLLS